MKKRRDRKRGKCIYISLLLFLLLEYGGKNEIFGQILDRHGETNHRQDHDTRDDISEENEVNGEKDTISRPCEACSLCRVKSRLIMLQIFK